MPDEAKDVFTEIYRTVAWSGGWPETVSGAGSTHESTQAVREGLAALFADGPLPPQPTVLDAPCGDFNWFRAVPGVGRYIGMDIVPALVEENARQYGNERARFVVGDLTRDPLPAADVLLCRDCLIHLSDAMVGEALANFRRSGIPWLLLTSHGNTENGTADNVGGYRPINFGLPPYSFPEPVVRIADHLGPHEKWLCLWRAEDVPAH